MFKIHSKKIIVLCSYGGKYQAVAILLQVLIIVLAVERYARHLSEANQAIGKPIPRRGLPCTRTD